MATDIAKNKKRKATIKADGLAKILGPTQYESELALRAGIPGVATALAFTPVGGEILFIESASMPGKGALQLTGQIGDVMKESAQAAFSILKSNAGKLGIEASKFTKSDYHIHVPAGAIPKDGPSAGVAMFSSLVSLLLHKPVRPDVAMTGEITLARFGAADRRIEGKDIGCQTGRDKDGDFARPQQKRPAGSAQRSQKRHEIQIRQKHKRSAENRPEC